ncbi:MAG: hypothetical protein WA477_14670 [Candidatus Sulfotelmatobacter sp.]
MIPPFVFAFRFLLARVADFVKVGDIQMSMLGGVVFHAGVMAHLFRILFHIVHGIVGDDAFSSDRLIHVTGEVDRAVLVKFPGAAIAGGE